MKTGKHYIKKLKLTPHPEGGYFREIYRSDEKIKREALPDRYSANRVFSTSIYFLLKGKQKSNLHKLKSDETWHFYDGSSVNLYVINNAGNLSGIVLGRNIDEGEVLQYTVKKDQWFCAEVKIKKSFSLIGCTVSPGFEFSDFKLGNRGDLLKLFPVHKDLITEFTKG